MNSLEEAAQHYMRKSVSTFFYLDGGAVRSTAGGNGWVHDLDVEDALARVGHHHEATALGGPTPWLHRRHSPSLSEKDRFQKRVHLTMIVYCEYICSDHSLAFYHASMITGHG